MKSTHFEASYLIETPLAPEAVAEVMAGEQSCGTFTRVAGETDDLRARARAQVLQVQPLGSVQRPSLPNAWLARQGYGEGANWQRARVRIAFPIANVGPNLPTLAATVSGNLYDLGEVSGLRLESLDLPPDYRDQFDLPTMAPWAAPMLRRVPATPKAGRSNWSR